MHESEMHERNCFLTLTYSDDNLPPDMSLQPKDFTDFMKRARKRLGKLRYFQCGEYSPKLHRPHHHAIMFGQDFAHDREPWKTTPAGDQLYRSQILEELWPHGFSTIGNVTFESAAYVARYCMKKVTGEKAENHYNGRKPDYCTMSRRPGLGKTWIEKYASDVYPSDQVISNGKPARPLAFYDAYLEATAPEEHARIKLKRAKLGIQHQDNNTADRRYVREEIGERKAKTVNRDFS